VAPYQKIAVECFACGKSIKKSPSAVKERNFCCRKCFGAYWSKTTGIKAKHRAENRRVECVCKTCGKQFTIIKSWLKNGGGAFCSRACMNAHKRTVTGEEHPLYTQVTCVCQWCGSEYKSKKVLSTRTKFCSRQCQGAYTIKHQARAATGIENAVEFMLKEVGADYESQKRMGRFLCDFYVCAADLVIECDGIYWHGIPKVKKRDKNKDKWLVLHGHRVLRLKEMDINLNPDWCKLQILIAVSV
jgi:very-short-patch-repair endonuclease